MYKLASQPQSIKQILSDSFRLYKVAFIRLVFWALVAGIISVLSQLITSTNNIENAVQQSSYTNYHLLLQPLLIIVLSLVPFSAMIFDIHQTMQGSKPTIKTAFLTAVRKWLPLIGAMVVNFIIMFIVAVVAYFLMMISKFVALLFAAAVAIYLLVSLFAWQPLIVSENQRVFQAFKNSFKIVKSNWWRTFAILLIPGLVVCFINFILGFTFDVLDPNKAHAIWQLVITAIVSMLFMPWLYGILLLQIHNLELRKKQ
jgi:hypothetical protein